MAGRPGGLAPASHQASDRVWPFGTLSLPLEWLSPLLALQTKAQVLGELLQLVRVREDKNLLAKVYRLLRYGCLYTGELAVGAIPIGPWRHYFYVQTVNFTPEGMDPAEAARIIGGLPVSQNTRPTLDVACGPFVLEDGQFDIELI